MWLSAETYEVAEEESQFFHQYRGILRLVGDGLVQYEEEAVVGWSKEGFSEVSGSPIGIGESYL